MVILVCGGAGYIGSHVNKLLTNKGYETIIFDNLAYGHQEAVKWGTFVEGDLKNVEDIEKVFCTYHIDIVFHFAAFAYVGESVNEPEKYYYNNVVNTLNLLQVMKRHSCNKIIFSSSCATFGEPLDLPITESMPQNPINPYGATKWMVEHIFKDYEKAYGLEFIVLRYFNVAGADPVGEIGENHNPEPHLIPLLLDAVSGVGETVKVFGTDYDTKDGSCIRDYIHVMDLADAHVLALVYLLKENSSDFFNLGNEKGISVLEVIKTVEKVTGKQCKVVHEARRAGDPAVLIGSSEKARQILGWKPKYEDIEVMVRDAWKWKVKKKDAINVVYACDDNFAEILAVSLTSLLENNRHKIELYLIAQNLAESTKHKLNVVAKKYELSIHFIEMPNLDEIVGAPIDSKKYSASTFSRIMLGSLLPLELEKVLYIDADSIIMEDLKELWEYDLCGKTMGGCSDLRSSMYNRIISVPKNFEYMNAGVLLIDLCRYRKHKYEDLLLEGMKQFNGALAFPDNDLICKYLFHDMKMLPQKYNVISIIYGCTYQNLKKLRNPTAMIAFDDYQEAKYQPTIVHFTGCFLHKARIWQEGCCHPYRKMYENYCSLTPWSTMETRKVKKRMVQGWGMKVYELLPSFFAIRIVGIMHSYLIPICRSVRVRIK